MGKKSMITRLEIRSSLRENFGYPKQLKPSTSPAKPEPPKSKPPQSIKIGRDIG